MTIKEMAIQQMDSIYETLNTLPKGERYAEALYHNFNGQACGVACMAARILHEAEEPEDAVEVLNYYNKVISAKMKAIYDSIQEEKK